MFVGTSDYGGYACNDTATLAEAELAPTPGFGYTLSTCSPTKVTRRVRPQCAKLDINSLHAWAESGNVFNETKSQGARPLVAAP